MKPIFKKVALALTSTAFAASCFAIAPAHAATTEASSHLQLISDQETVGAGGEIGYHLIYHNVQNKNNANVLLKINLPAGLDVNIEELTDASFDIATRTLLFNLKDVESNGARVIHFNLKVKGSVQVGTDLDLDCELIEDGNISVKTPKVKVRTGNQIDQPFIVGYPDGLFHPERYMTRAEAAAVVVRLKNLDNATSLTEPYTDVAGDHWANTYITQVTNSGYMSGYQDGSFHPDAPISRAELVKLVLSMRGVHEVPLAGFDDTVGHWSEKFIGTAKGLKFVDGVNDKEFHPNGPTERQAAAKFFNVAMFRGPLVDGESKVTQHFPDVAPNHWSFGWVEEASVVAHESVRKGRGLEYLIRYLPEKTEEM